MLDKTGTILFSFLCVMILSPFGVAIPAAVLPVDAQVISDEWKNEVELYLLEVDKNTTAEIVIYVLDSLYGHGIIKDGIEINDITQLGVYIFNELSLDTPSGAVVGIGKKGKDNGVLILVAMEDRAWRIEVGYGLEGYITDVESNRIAEDYLVPNFQEGEYGKGLLETVDALAKEIPTVTESEKMPTRGRYFYDNAETPTDEELPWWVIVLIIIFVFFIISVGGRLGGGRVGRRWGGSRSGGGRSGGGGGGGRSGGGGSGGRW
jgi:uncharacterized membrane protein YgcG